MELRQQCTSLDVPVYPIFHANAPLFVGADGNPPANRRDDCHRPLQVLCNPYNMVAIIVSSKNRSELISHCRELGHVLNVVEAFTKYSVEDEVHGGKINYWAQESKLE